MTSKRLAREQHCYKELNSIFTHELNDNGSSSMTCSCCESSFQNKDVGHVVTWDLRIVKDRCLRKLLEKGLSYREPTEINLKKNLEICTNSIKEFKHQWAKKQKLPQSVFTEWESTIVEIKLKIRRIKSKHKRKGRTVKRFLTIRST